MRVSAFFRSTVVNEKSRVSALDRKSVWTIALPDGEGCLKSLAEYPMDYLKELEADLGSSLKGLRLRRANAKADDLMRSYWYGNEPGYREAFDATKEEYYNSNPILYEKDGDVYMLDLSELNLTYIPDSIARFAQLKRLRLNHNNISNINLLSGLACLERLDCRSNKITEIPEKLAILENLIELNTGGNPITIPPYEVCQGGIDTIRSWYQSAGIIYRNSEGLWCIVEDQKDPVDMISLYEIKMVLIGNGNVGKTSLARRLCDRRSSLPTPQERTHGLAAYRWEKSVHVPDEDKLKTFRFNIWDFGGQGKFRAVQQFFCSRKSLYLYVTSSDDQGRDNQDDYWSSDYWLNMVCAYSFDLDESRASPVIHVSNKQDLGAAPVNEVDMQAIYPELYPLTVRTSALTNNGLDDLETVIEAILPNVSFDVFTSTYSRRWLELKEALEERTESYIPRSEYDQMAHAYGLSDLETEQWLHVLHRLGTLIIFNSLPELRDTVILRPEWIREVAYDILQSEAIEEDHGRFRQSDFLQIWPNRTAAEHQKLIVLMQAFELCYVTRDEYDKALYITPALFPAKPPPNYHFPNLSSLNSIAFQIRFQFDPFLPPGLLPRLMVRLHIWLYRDYSWRNGAVLHDRDTYAEITEYWKTNRLTIKLKGAAPQKFFNTVRQEVEQIVVDLKVNNVLHHLKVTPEGFYQEEWWELDRLEKLHINFWQQEDTSTGVSLFVSYARKDEGFKDELIKHLSGLRQIRAITDWHDRQILPGQTWDEEIKEKLESSQVVLFLVSSDFMYSDYIHDVEISRTIERYKKGQVVIVPIMVRPCDFNSSSLSLYQPLPLVEGEGLKPVSTWKDRDEAWLNVVEGIKLVIGALSHS